MNRIRDNVLRNTACFLVSSCLLSISAFMPGCADSGEEEARLVVGRPPETAVKNVIDVVHDRKITDPYRWLEDQESPETREWIRKQNEYADSILGQIPGQDALREKVAGYLKIDTISAPIARGGRYFLTKRKADQALGVIYMREGLDGADRVLIDPHSMSEDHTTNVGIVDISRDGKLLAYNVRDGGVDETEIRIMDVDTGKDLPDVLPEAYYMGLSFEPDNSGFYYNKYTEQGSRAYYHEMGGDVSDDRLVFGEGVTPEKIAFVGLSEDGRWLIAHLMHGTSGPTEVYLKEAAKDNSWRTVINDGRSRSFAQMAGDVLLIQTNLDAPNQRVMTADPKAPSVENWRELVPEEEVAVLEGSAGIGGAVVVSYLDNVKNVTRIYGLDGNLVREVEMEGMGSFGAGSGTWESSEAFFYFSSFHVPPTIYRYDMDTGKKSVWARIDVPVDSDGMVLNQVFYTSKDGTRVPMFVLHGKEIDLDGKNPALLTGYGGFTASMTPSFSGLGSLWVESGGVYCVANLRGGGEFGEKWHQAGMLENKQNVFDDFIAAGEWLVENGYTSPERLGIMGGSNGGLLVGACLVQKPCLYGAVICTYPLLDMVRYHECLVGRLWIAEYGSSDDPEQFEFIRAYSPYHNAEDGADFPATLFITGDGDTRVDPMHARKMTALLQAKRGGDNPIMLRYHIKAGHSGGMPVKEQIDETTEMLSFLKWRLAR